MKQKVGLFIGRFQPLHLGHIDALNQAKQHWVTEFLMGIGSANKEHTAENPFTYEERKTMVTKVLKALHIKFSIYAVPDMDSDEDRKNFIIENLPKFDMVISGNPWTSDIFKKTKYKICILKIRKDIKSTTIRHMLHIGDNIGLGQFVPHQISTYLEHIKASKRLAEYYTHEGIWPSVAVDGIIFTKDKKIVVIKRKNPPLGYALPGGFVDYGETTEQALIREMKEEIWVQVKIRKLAGVMSDPKRDPRAHIISIVYIADIISGKVKAGDDAKSVKIMKLEDAKKLKMVANHDKFLQKVSIQ